MTHVIMLVGVELYLETSSELDSATVRFGRY